MSARPDKDPDLTDLFVRMHWAEARKLGRERFAWRHRALPIGVPMGLCLLLWAYWELGYSVRDVFTI